MEKSDLQPLDVDAMRAHASEAAALLKVLSNVDRLMLLCHIAQQPCTVAALSKLTGIAQPSLSQQLGVLRRQGLVHTQREGKYIRYAVTDVRALALMQVVHQVFCEGEV